MPRTFASNFFYLNQEKSSANSMYHALQTSLRTTKWHGVSSQANFVWSHSIDTASDLEDFEPNEAQPQNSTFPRGDRGNSSFDIRRRFTWNFVYEFPKSHGSMQKLINGWGLDGILNLQDGQPWHLNYEFEGDYSGAGEGYDRPDVVAPMQYNFGDPLRFPESCFLCGAVHVGISRRPERFQRGKLRSGHASLRKSSPQFAQGPSFKEFNFSVFKSTNLTEHMIWSCAPSSSTC